MSQYLRASRRQDIAWSGRINTSRHHLSPILGPSLLLVTTPIVYKRDLLTERYRRNRTRVRSAREMLAELN